jgi:adenylylsulfate kinase-like enzyme
MANQNRRPFTIAISGCSSAGKSTLAFLLAEIFSGKSFLIQRRFGVAFLLRRCGFALKRLF